MSIITGLFYGFSVVLVGIGAAMVEALACKVIAWEKERGTEFLYDGVSTLFNITIDFC